MGAAAAALAAKTGSPPVVFAAAGNDHPNKNLSQINARTHDLRCYSPVGRVCSGGEMKANNFVALGFVLAVTAGVAAQAQGLTEPWDEMTPLTAQDREIIKKTVQRDIHDRRPDTVAAWSNPASGHSGTITLLSKSARQGMSCERIEYRIMEPGSAHLHSQYVFTSCRLPDGRWKLAD